jgi:glycosyltransferase 2 family protein
MQIAGAVARAVRRRLSWETVGVTLSLAIIAAACFTLFKLLRDVDIGKFADAVYATPAHAVVVAGLLIAASYISLTFYDFFALRTIGQTHIPYRIAALTGFLSYTIGHNLGATAFTGGVVRFRIYRSWGLSLIDVAKVAFVTGLTFWLGNSVVLGVGIAYAPDIAGSINQLPPWVNRTIALAALGAIAVYLIWLLPRPRVIGRDGWTLTLPGARSTLLQIGIGITDLGLAALAMFTLMSAHASVDVVQAVIAFVFSALLGFLSHAPGSLGVFDAAMLIALPQVEKEQLLAALVIFRCLYFIVPFCIAILLFGLRELSVSAKS